MTRMSEPRVTNHRYRDGQLVADFQFRRDLPVQSHERLRLDDEIRQSLQSAPEIERYIQLRLERERCEEINDRDKRAAQAAEESMQFAEAVGMEQQVAEGEAQVAALLERENEAMKAARNVLGRTADRVYHEQYLELKKQRDDIERQINEHIPTGLFTEWLRLNGLVRDANSNHRNPPDSLLENLFAEALAVDREREPVGN